MVAGQSNAMGMGYTLNHYAYRPGPAAVVAAALFDQSQGTWHYLHDPTGYGGHGGAGSVWPFVALRFTQTQTPVFGLINAAIGSSTIQSWQPGAVNYELMKTAINLAGEPIKAVLWWQGEAGTGLTQAQYHDYLATIAAQVQIDFGCPLIPTKLQASTGTDSADLARTNAAIAQAWVDVPNVRPGPDLSDIVTDDDYHLQTDAKVQLAAERWWAAIQAALYP